MSQACKEAAARMMGSVRRTIELGCMAVDEKTLIDEDGSPIVVLDDCAWQILAKLLGIPVPYMNKLGLGMRVINVNYWLNVFGDKEVLLVYRDNELLDIIDGVEISISDMLDIIYSVLPDGEVFRVWNQTNATVFDVVDFNRHYDSSRDVYFPGMRVVLKNGLNAPELSPIFVADSSCGTIECADRFEPLNIKSMGYGDIIRMVRERAVAVMGSHDRLFDCMREMEREEVPNPRRRISLYCSEHAVPRRISDKALAVFDDSGLSSMVYGDIIGLFSTLGFADGVRRSGDTRMQRLAGHIITKALGEKRCPTCDALDAGA